MLEESGTPLNLVESIETNAKHYLDIMSKAVDAAMPEPTREIKYVLELRVNSFTNNVPASRTMFWMFSCRNELHATTH